eukprot:TRINITY_DN2390_c0_g1_i1.p1 TRINITY_DN2390_c0_g1~~TRINITY_DN2390_c0_g1_i1.p1  ORF type:complete len:231 (+),score=22.76 TRINITY_DN2390_c0_g1_i1:198-890(+)
MSGFRNLKPRTREERNAQANREQLEKERLANRTGGFHSRTYEDVRNPTENTEASLSYMSSADRFHTDVAGEERQRMEASQREQQQRYEEKRHREIEEQRRKNEMEERVYLNEQQKWEQKREAGSKTNTASVAYNVISLEYDDSKEGQQLLHKDQMAVVGSDPCLEYRFRHQQVYRPSILSSRLRLYPHHLTHTLPPLILTRYNHHHTSIGHKCAQRCCMRLVTTLLVSTP